MPTVIETKSSPNSNAYASVSEADGYFETLYGFEDWAELDGAVKERLLITATKQIDQLNVVFPKANTTQTLKFPVGGYAGMDDGYDSAKLASILQAYHTFTNSGKIKERFGNKLEGIQAQTIGPISTTFAPGSNPFDIYDPHAISLLAEYIDLSFRL